MTNKFIKFILCIFCIVQLIACQKKTDLYISLTSAYQVDDLNNIDMDTYMYNINEKELKKVSHLKYFSQYPLTTYSKENNCVYYGHFINDALYSSDAIYKYDLKTKKSEKYIDYVDAINDIRVLSNDQIFIVGQLKDVEDHNIVPTIYNTKAKTIEYFNWDNDQYVSYSHYNPLNKEIVLAHYSLKENYQLMEDYNEKVNEYAEKGLTLENENPTTYISIIKNNQIVEKITLGQLELKGICLDDNYIYYLVKYDNRHYSLMRYDRKSKQSEEILNQSIGIDFYDLVYIDNDDLYAITINSQPQYKLVKYNLKNRSLETIYETNGLQAINNCQIYLNNES